MSKFTDHELNKEIKNVTSIGDFLIKIHTDEGKTVIAGALDNNATVTSNEVKKVYESESVKPNIVVSKFGVIWSGSAIDYSRQHNMGWGGMGQIFDAFHTDDYAGIQKREYKFVEEGLLRHSRVTHLERIYDRVFIIHRKSGLPPFTITLIDSYELSGEEVRNAIEKYGNFDAVLKTNPNGNPTAKAYSAAKEIGAEILAWSKLLSRLNRK